MSVREEKVKLWFRDNGDKTLRLNYNLSKESLVLDVGGYEGQWASDIYEKYRSNIVIFEPVSEWARKIAERFSHNTDIRVYKFGLSNDNKSCPIYLADDSTSVHGSGGNYERIELVKGSEFIQKENMTEIDLMKINIEGGEYELLEDLIETRMIQRVKDIQVQFHECVPNAKEKMTKLQARLEKTHYLTYQYEFVWENWRRKPTPIGEDIAHQESMQHPWVISDSAKSTGSIKHSQLAMSSPQGRLNSRNGTSRNAHDRKNAESFDSGMEHLPVLISYPGSGGNWLNALMELYFKRPGWRKSSLPCLSNSDIRTDFMWIHDHDRYADLLLPHKNVLYIYKDPCDVIFSLLTAEHEAITTQLVAREIYRLSEHYRKYFVNGWSHTVIQYEKLKMDLPGEFKKILAWFDLPCEVNVEELYRCGQMIQKKECIREEIDRWYFNQHLLPEDHERQNRAFRSQYKEIIYESVITKELQPFFVSLTSAWEQL